MIYPWQQPVWEVLQRIIRQDRLPHGLLFTGASGCGNEAFIEALTQRLLCLQPQATGEACRQCRSCQVYQAGAHPDLYWAALTEKKILGIETIRELGYFLQLTLSYSRVRVATIWQADSMSHNAANSLLKSLEEPANRTHLLLFAEHIGRLPPTIRSRCQIWRLPTPNMEQAMMWLNTQPIQSSPQALLSQALGKPLYALQLDDGEKVKQQQLFIQQLLQVLQQKLEMTTFVHQWHKQALEPLLDWQLTLLHDSLRQHYLPNTTRQQQVVQQVHLSFSVPQLWRIHERLLSLKPFIHHPLNSQVFVEDMLTAWLINQ